MKPRRYRLDSRKLIGASDELAERGPAIRFEVDEPGGPFPGRGGGRRRTRDRLML